MFVCKNQFLFINGLQAPFWWSIGIFFIVKISFLSIFVTQEKENNSSSVQKHA